MALWSVVLCFVLASIAIASIVLWLVARRKLCRRVNEVFEIFRTVDLLRLEQAALDLVRLRLVKPIILVNEKGHWINFCPRCGGELTPNRPLRRGYGYRRRYMSAEDESTLWCSKWPSCRYWRSRNIAREVAFHEDSS